MESELLPLSYCRWYYGFLYLLRRVGLIGITQSDPVNNLLGKSVPRPDARSTRVYSRTFWPSLERVRRSPLTQTLLTASSEMSLGRNFFCEFRPLFRMLEDSFFGRAPVAYSGRGRLVFNRPFFGLARNGLRPVVDVAEEGNSYIIEAELPGVRKGDINVEIGDNGRCVTIQGKIIRRSRQQEQPTIETSVDGKVQEGKHPLPEEQPHPSGISEPASACSLTRHEQYFCRARVDRTHDVHSQHHPARASRRERCVGHSEGGGCWIGRVKIDVE